MIQKNPIPELGKSYHFFDDGKILESMHYIAVVTQIIPINKAKEILFKAKYDAYCEISTYYDINSNIDEYKYTKSLYDIWKEHTEHTNFLFDNDTECFIECHISEYNDNYIYFARTKYGEWFSMNIQSPWQGGLLDVTGKIYKKLQEHEEENKRLFNDSSSSNS